MTPTVAETAPLRDDNRPRAARSKLARFRPPFSLRCGAILIDYTILVSIVAFGTLVSRMLGGGARSAGSSSETAGIFIALMAAVLNLGMLPGLTGVTVGKWATGLHIERVNGTKLGIGRAFLRHFVGYPLSFVTLGLGFLVAVVNSRGRGLHDLIADTVVIREAVVLGREATRKT
jgi:uncharacterized RDD family membrane protein YckC